MYVADMTLFKAPEHKSTTLTIRLTPNQKACICDLAKQRKATVARFILSLVGNEYGRIHNTHDTETPTATGPVDNEIHMSAAVNDIPPHVSSVIDDDKSTAIDFDDWLS